MFMNLMEIGWEALDWMHLAQDRDQWRVLVNMALNFRVLSKARNLTRSMTISFAKWALSH
jgi:hypothetical protein